MLEQFVPTLEEIITKFFAEHDTLKSLFRLRSILKTIKGQIRNEKIQAYFRKNIDDNPDCTLIEMSRFDLQKALEAGIVEHVNEDVFRIVSNTRNISVVSYHPASHNSAINFRRFNRESRRGASVLPVLPSDSNLVWDTNIDHTDLTIRSRESAEELFEMRRRHMTGIYGVTGVRGISGTTGIQGVTGLGFGYTGITGVTGIQREETKEKIKSVKIEKKYKTILCTKCEGKGIIENSTCHHCNGERKIKVERNIKLEFLNDSSNSSSF